MAQKEVNAANLYLGKGKVYLDILSAGASTGERFLGNCITFEATPADERLPIYSSASADAPLIADTLIRRKFEAKLVLSEHDRDNVALVLMGAQSALAQGTASIVDQAIAATRVKKGYYFRLLHRQVSAVVVTSDPAGTTYTVATDYEVDAVTGRIYIVPTGTIADGTPLLVDYTYAADTDKTVQIGTQATIECFMRFIGDPSVGPVIEVELWKVSISPSGTLSLIGDAYGNIELTAKVLEDATNHPTEKFGRIIYR